VSILSLLNGFKVFREAYLVAGAYPHDSIYLLQHLFNNWFQNLDIGRLCAAAVMLTVVLLVIILIVQRFLRESD
jgi:multiple sugar transport system permease protein